MPRVRPAADLAATLADISLETSGGQGVRLGELWADQPALLVHLRHFG
ncbi:MAG TPA: hypothetical protein VM287_09785 [Egibacteraceae bacterium]|nr:hypothetical protein [Egibacteraceae bacterium]HVM14608.1 hypothetical protein [Egibacteraceae bacterium]HVM21401.1 hypothetical protein [Egibacteraceae bacterium]